MTIRVVLVIVIYNKKAEDSTTIKSLLSSQLSDVTVVLHNNGPLEIELSDSLLSEFNMKKIDLELVNCILNKPLSVIYNDIIKRYSDFDRFIIFDDDSQLTHSFTESIYSGEYDIQLPLIVSRKDQQIYYPMVDGKPIKAEGELPAHRTHSIGSGLIINKSLVEKFQSNHLELFDENYALYGVDVSLFRRIWTLSAKGVNFRLLSSSKLIHSLSRAEESDNDFRRKERLIDFAITVRRYPSIRGALSFCKKIIVTTINLRFSDAKIMMGSLVFGCHPRCRK